MYHSILNIGLVKMLRHGYSIQSVKLYLYPFGRKRKNHNLRNFYIRTITIGGQQEELYDKADEMQEKYPLLEGGLVIEHVAAIKQGNWVVPAVATTDQEVMRKKQR